MKRKRYTEEQIITTLKQNESGTPVRQLIRQVEISEQTFYRWKSKHGGMEVSNAKRQLVDYANIRYSISSRRVCRLFGLRPSSVFLF